MHFKAPSPPPHPPGCLKEKVLLPLWCFPRYPFTDLGQIHLVLAAQLIQGQLMVILGKGRQVALGKKPERVSRMHLRAVGARQGSKEHSRPVQASRSARAAGAALPVWETFPGPGRVGWGSPWPPPSSARPAPSLSVSSCRPHFPQWWLQASTPGRPAGGRENLGS